VFDYATGKQDWLAAGLPTEGEQAGQPRAGGFARSDVPTCALNEGVREVRDRVKATEWNVCVVVNQERIVMGLLREKELGSDDDAIVEQAMRPGPSTFRPNVPIDEMALFMIEHDLESAPVTSPDGRLIGMLLREDAARAARELHEAHHRESGSDDHR
jgi:Mg/Co/Ni transporter MgtE